MDDMPKLNILIKKIRNRKYKLGLIKYLSTLSYDEYHRIFTLYTTVIVRCKNFFDDGRFLSKKWFKSKFLLGKFNELSEIFLLANEKFYFKRYTDLQYLNERALTLMEEIAQNELILENLKVNVDKILTIQNIINKTIYYQNETYNETILINVILIDTLYSYHKIEKSMTELKELKIKISGA